MPLRLNSTYINTLIFEKANYKSSYLEGVSKAFFS